jgi:hypothetical protein
MSDDSKNPSTVAPGRGMLFLTNIARGGVVFSSDLAQRIAELLCEAHYGNKELARQRPFSVTDKDTYWRVEGNWNRDGEIEGTGTFFVSIEKYDARVTDFGILFHPAVVPLLKEHLRRMKKGDT